MKKPGRIKAKVLDWLGVPVSLTDSDFWSLLSKVEAGQRVNQDTVMSLSAAWACTLLISETIATLPLKIYKRTDNGRIVANDHPLNHIVSFSPNVDSTATQYWEAKVAAALLRGNGISRKRIVSGKLASLEFIPNEKIFTRTSGDGTVSYFIKRSNGPVKVDRDELYILPGFSIDGKLGLSVIQYGAKVFGSALAADRSASSTFEKGLSKTVAFKIDRVLKKEQREEFRELVQSMSGAMNAGRSPLLEAGMDAKEIGITPVDAQLIESRGFSVEEICRFFRVDPTLIGHGDKSSNWGTGLEQKMMSFLTFTLRPWLRRIETSVNMNLLTTSDRVQGYYAEFAIEGLLRADSAGRSAFYSTMVNNGIFSRDEVREKENLPKRGGNANELTVQSAMTLLDVIGNDNDSDRARAALAAWLNYGERNE